MEDSPENQEPPAALEDAPEPVQEAEEAKPSLPIPKKRGRPAGSKTVNRAPKVDVVLQPVETKPVEPPTPKARTRKPRARVESPAPEPIPEAVQEPALSPSELRRMAIEENLKRRQADYEARKAHYTNMLREKMFTF